MPIHYPKKFNIRPSVVSNFYTHIILVLYDLTNLQSFQEYTIPRTLVSYYKIETLSTAVKLLIYGEVKRKPLRFFGVFLAITLNFNMKFSHLFDIYICLVTR